MIYLIRHGQDDETYIGGWSDVGLLKEGEEEVKESAKWIQTNLYIKEIYSSDIKRAKQTSEMINTYLQIPITYTPLLREQNKGTLNGMIKKEAIQKYPHLFDNVTIDTIYPQGECLRDLYNRIKVYLKDLEKLKDNTLIVTHRGVINMIYYILNNQPLDMNKTQFKVTTASVHELDVKNKLIKRIR